MGVKVTLTVEAGEGQLSYVEAEGATYQTAKVQAGAKIGRALQPIGTPF